MYNNHLYNGQLYDNMCTMDNKWVSEMRAPLAACPEPAGGGGPERATKCAGKRAIYFLT